jgi:hypothetical protein
MPNVSMAVSAALSEQAPVQTRSGDTAPSRKRFVWRQTQILSWLVPALLVVSWELLARLGKIPRTSCQPPPK